MEDGNKLLWVIVGFCDSRSMTVADQSWPERWQDGDEFVFPAG